MNNAIRSIPNLTECDGWNGDLTMATYLAAILRMVVATSGECGMGDDEKAEILGHAEVFEAYASDDHIIPENFDDTLLWLAENFTKLWS